ncbi:DUF924 domain-containing protein [Jiella sp. MQZ9-1]|uniref:DUF924 domain-containing protein n=1 Tax=Jiella flava TaxID=2816857 RepID=A0A939FY33_9HYPH|nr:DUF924 family protein [Jiella flava]MBO0663645.1 DUF924 domain-containing protein [Jiella flava]MCD2472220.1 DUF924 domain-containing protein [Jiella flava]
MSRPYAPDPQTVVEFWREAGPNRWFKKDTDFDRTIRSRFGDLYEMAARGDLDFWAEDATGMLALIILLDQFPRNMFRRSPLAFATDEKALGLARSALARGDHETVAEDINQFLVMPLMHSEALQDQEDCLAWMTRIGNAENVDAAEDHRDIIAKFGRFPHRNIVLGRETTAEEEAYLDAGGFLG